MSDTPETDAAAERNIYGVACKVDVDFARKLERERDKAQEELQEWKDGAYAAEQWKDIAERSIGYVYDNDWDPEACDIIKDYEKLAGGPHPIHSK